MDEEPPERLGGSGSQLTKWFKISLIVLIVWTLVEKVASYLAYVGYATIIAVGGLFLAYLMYPIVRWSTRRMPLWAGIGAVYATFAFVAGCTMWLLLPIVMVDLQHLVLDLPRYEERLRDVVNGASLPFTQHSSSTVRGSVDAFISQMGDRTRGAILAATDNAVGLTASFVSLAALVIAIPAASIYMLLEATAVKRFVLALVPREHRGTGDRIITEVDAVLGGFVRGQVLVAITVAFMVSLLLLVLRVPYAVLIGVWAGALDMVPYLGAAAGAIPGVLIALLSNGIVDAAIVSAGFAAIFQLEGSVIAPKIVSHTVGVSPIAVIFAVLIGGEAFGFAGLLAAVPVVGVVRVIIENTRPPH